MQPNGNGLVSNLENLKQVFQDHNFHPDHLTWLEPFIQAAGQGSLLPEQATLLQRMWYTTGKIIRKQATRDDLHHLFGSQQIWIECMDEAMFGPVFYRLGKVLQAAKHPIPSSAAASKPSTRTQHPLFALMIRQLHEAKALLPFFKGIMYWRQDVRAELVARYELLNGKLPVALTVNDPDGTLSPRISASPLLTHPVAVGTVNGWDSNTASFPLPSCCFQPIRARSSSMFIR